MWREEGGTVEKARCQEAFGCLASVPALSGRAATSEGKFTRLGGGLTKIALMAARYPLLEKRLLGLFQDRAAQHLVRLGLGLGFRVRA